MSLNNHPKYTKEFIGHKKQKLLFEDAYFNNKLHHSWLLEGPAGIGKATFAYSIARAILSLNEPNNEISLFETKEIINTFNFKFNKDNLIHRRVSENTHTDLKIIEKINIDKSPYSNDIIPVNKVREIENFFSKTSGEGGWRIAIIDSLDNLNKYGANSLLKIIEEPPKNCLILLISNNKSNVLDTIRSRCRILTFSSLNEIDTKLIINNYNEDIDEENLFKLNIISNGSPGKALIILHNNGLEIYDYLLNIFLSLPNIKKDSVDKLMHYTSSSKNLFGIKIINLLITIFFNRTYRRSLGLIKIDISNIEKEAQENFINNYNISEIPRLWENIFTQINNTIDLNLDKKQSLINMIDNIKDLKNNKNVLDAY